jgi:hypothetical protein
MDEQTAVLENEPALSKKHRECPEKLCWRSNAERCPQGNRLRKILGVMG